MDNFAQLTSSEGLPASIHTEIAILGAMLLEPEAIVTARAGLRAEDLSLDSHQRVYGAICAVFEADGKVDFTTVRNELERRKELDAIGGPAYLAYLSEGIPRRLNIESYVRIVKDKAMLRRLLLLFHRGSARAADQSEDAEQVLAELQEEMVALQADASGSHGAATISAVVPAVVERVLAERDAPPQGVLGLATGVVELDGKMGGLRAHEYTILAGESGDGKTALAVQMTLEAALQGIPVGWFSLEMTKEQLVRRMFASLSGSANEHG